MANLSLEVYTFKQYCLLHEINELKFYQKQEDYLATMAAAREEVGLSVPSYPDEIGNFRRDLNTHNYWIIYIFGPFSSVYKVFIVNPHIIDICRKTQTRLNLNRYSDGPVSHLNTTQL